ncbi:rho guanine nucleotide exchange factor 12 isoform X2 [Pangasianodon hypophthalmus]|uniref:rho guanine nucleotide exchange factor 12 isoform X2 n=1 Tax=Pangasianodon hypophthalmus TaxID=310915 RepID=UPI000EFDBD1B|nr:rho guanine nucleotide exchange factor 12 isoform X2 [Pangasianodon hypophthalmus]
MSGSQSTIADRFPKKPTRPGSILNKDHPPDKKPKSEKVSVPPTHDFDPTELPVQSVERRPESCGLVQRCVIIQKDENGFGLTVSGDNPVFVQLVKEDGAAMRAGVQTGDRIIKVNGTLVTHSNHVEVVKLIKSGSYVALTVLGRPPGLPQIPLSEGEGDGDPLSSLSSPHSPGPTVAERSSSSSTSPSDRITSPLPAWEDSGAVFNQKVDILQKMLMKEQQDLQAMKEEYSRNPTARLLKDIQEAQKHIPLLQGQLSKATTAGQDGLLSPRPGEGDPEEGGGLGDVDASLSWQYDLESPMNSNSTPVTPSMIPESPYQRDTPCHSPKSTPRISLNSCPSPDGEDVVDLDSNYQCSVGSPSSRLPPPIIGAEDDDFDTEQEQMNGQCSCFQTIELLKSRPAHLAAFLHHVVSQFDPAPLLCYLYAELYKQSNPKETRRIFGELHSTFMDRTAQLKVVVPDSISADMDRWKPDLIPEDVQRQHVQQLQDTLLPDIQKHLEDFRQKRSMGLTLAEAELSRLDTERVRDRVALERERSCSEHIISKINEVLLTPSATEEEKCTAMQFVIQAYMKHLGVKVKESRGFEPKPKLINLLPKIKKTIKPEKDGGVEEKLKKSRFQIMRSHNKRPSRTDISSITKALEQNKQRTQKQLSQTSLGTTDQAETPSAGRTRSSQSSDGPDGSTGSINSPLFSPSPAQSSDSTARDLEPGTAPLTALPRLGEVGPLGEGQDSSSSGTHFDFTYPLDHLQEEEPETDRNPDGGTPRPLRRMEPLSSGEVQSEDDQAFEVEPEQDPPHWQTLVSTDVLALLPPHEIKRQEVINELFYTERAHLRMLKVLDNVFYQRMTREAILPPADIKNIFTNLEEIVQLHVSITEQMTAIRKKNETAVVDLIGDDLLSWFSGTEEEKIKRAVGTFCSNQPFALELIKSRQKKDQRFAAFVQEAESNRQCRRLQLKDIIPVEMQRLTKYPLLLENIAKYTDDTEEKSKVKRACECCRQILNHVNQEVKEAENKQRLEDYQRRLDLSSLKQSEYPMIAEFKNLNLTKRKMVHEGPLSWKVNKDKTIELYTLLLEDILVLLQKQDEKLILKCHSKNLAGTAETKHIFSPIIKLSTVLVRSVATDNKSFFVVSMSDYGAQIYELMAQTVSEQKTWHDLIGQRADCMKSLPQNDGEREADDEMNSGMPKMNKDPDRISTGSIQSPEKDATSCSEIMQIPTAGSNPFDTKSEDEGEAEGEGEHSLQVQDEEEDEETFLDPELAERLPFLKQRSRHAIAVEEKDLDTFDLPPLMADEALRTLAALRQLLINHMDGQEDVDRDRERGEAELRAGSLQGSEENTAPGGSVENGAERTETAHTRTENRHELPSGDTGFFEGSEDFGSYMVLEGYGGSGESSTDDDGQACSTEPAAAGDSVIDLKKLLSSASSQSRGPNFSRQVMTHLRLLQGNLQQLKDVESKYNQLCQRHSEQAATESEENKDKS